MLLLKGATRKGRVDVLGAILATAALILMVYAIVSAEVAGWTSLKTLGLLSLAVALFIVFLTLQKNKKRSRLCLYRFSRCLIFQAGTW